MKFGRGPLCKRKSLRNCATLCMLFPLALLLYCDPFLLLWWPPKPAEPGHSLPLDMATHSIDDMYDGCRAEKASMIDSFGVFEWHHNSRFSFAWASAETKAKKPVHQDLKEEHAIVLYMYTQEKYIQKGINRAVKTGKYGYNTWRFPFHYLYFYLTDAIQVLRRNQTCRITYYRTQERFNRNVINTNMRFGTFTLVASSKQSLDLNGNGSCFEIYSCFGADITYYSAKTHMAQVLIPPYEVFKITDVLTNKPWCRVVYKLRSTKMPRSDLNCKLNERQMEVYLFGDISTHWKASSIWMMSACLMLLIIISVILVKRRQESFVAAVLSALLALVIILVMLELKG